MTAIAGALSKNQRQFYFTVDGVMITNAKDAREIFNHMLLLRKQGRKGALKIAGYWENYRC